jgi:hypothetical protein
MYVPTNPHWNPPYVPTNPHWARVVGYDPFSLWVIHKEGLCPSSGDINRLMIVCMYVNRGLNARSTQKFIISNFAVLKNAC